jgi:hypothetical protein
MREDGRRYRRGTEVAVDNRSASVVVGIVGSDRRASGTAHRIVEERHRPALVIPPVGRSASVGDEPGRAR